MKEFLKTNSIFGIGSCFISLVVSILDSALSISNLWRHWSIIVIVIVALTSLLMLIMYLSRRKKSVTIKVDKE